MAQFFSQHPGEAATLVTTRDQVGRELKVTLPLETEDPQVIRALRREWNVRETPIERARNLVPNPSFEIDTYYWYDNETGIPARNFERMGGLSWRTSGDYSLRWYGDSLDSEGYSFPGFSTLAFPVTAGVNYTASVDVLAAILPPPEGNANVWLLMRFWDSGGWAIGDSPNVSIPQGSQGRLTTSLLAPPTATEVNLIIFTIAPEEPVAHPVNMWIDSAMLTENEEEEPPYFDGDSPFAEWVGTPHQSASVLYW